MGDYSNKVPLWSPLAGGRAVVVFHCVVCSGREMFGFGSKVSAALPSIVSQRYSALKNTGEGHYCIRPWAFAWAFAKAMAHKKVTAHESAYFLGCRGGRSLEPSLGPSLKLWSTRKLWHTSPLPFFHEEFALWVKDCWFWEQVSRNTAGWVLI